MNHIGRPPTALTIAGSDSGGGAGIQADLKTFAALGVHGLAAITSITAQNTLKVLAIQDVGVELLREQIGAVAEDIGVDAAKTGMLHTEEIISTVAEEVSHYRFPLVVDPVMVAKAGAELLEPEAVEALREQLLPLAKVVTPNRFEAEQLANIRVKDLGDAQEAAERIASLGPEVVVVKGGHLEGGESVDLVFMRGKVEVLRRPRLASKNTHGTGCSFSAAIAGYLAKGLDALEAIRGAKDLGYQAIKYGLSLGGGHGPVNPLAPLYLESEKIGIIEGLEEALERLEGEPAMVDFLPEVRMNLVYALPGASEPREVAGFPGRITWDGRRLVAVSRPRFGASKHMASTILTVMRRYPRVRAAINLRHSEEGVRLAQRLGMTVTSYDREEEPEGIKHQEGATIPWGVEKALSKIRGIPDIIYHLGDVGKEPMITILGRDPGEVSEKVLRLVRASKED